MVDQSKIRLSIPAQAEEQIIAFYPDNKIKQCYYLLEGKVIAYRFFDPEQLLSIEYGLCGEMRQGWTIEYHEKSSQIEFCCYYDKGKQHGRAYQFAPNGAAVCFSDFEKGTGVELWCVADKGNYQLAESYHFRDGKQFLQRWWIIEDFRRLPNTISEEVYESEDYRLTCAWDIDGVLRSGSPSFSLIKGKVTAKKYEAYLLQYPELPTFAEMTKDNLRRPPEEWINQFSQKK